MKISTKGRYALRLLIDLAEHQGEGFISLKEIAERQDISKKYLEQIILILSNADILQTTRGAHGGYRLARQPKDYSVGEILRLTEGNNLAPVACVEDAGICERMDGCATRKIWEGLARVVNDYLDSVTLQDLVQTDD